MNGKPLLLVLSMLSVAFAGCTADNEDPTELGGPVDDSFNLGSKGAINGLIVDDNFRPVQLKSEWGPAGPGDFQDEGFVLVVETGQRLETSENGEFQVLPLEPGRYTIKVAADNHEAIDRIVEVVAGEFTEITLEARRQFSGGGTILSQEETLFISCSITTTGIKVALAAVGGCGDTSGDSGRFDFYTNYQSIADDIRGLVTEMRAHQDGYYDVTLRTFETENCECDYGGFFLHNERYGKIVLYTDKAVRIDGSEKENTHSYHYLEDGEEGWRQPGSHDTDGSGYWALTFDYEFQTALFPDHPSKYWQDQAIEPTQPVVCGFVLPENPGAPVWVNRQYIDAVFCDAWGNGVTFGTKAQFLQTAFLYELPEEGIDDYCALCDDADIPE